MPEYGDFLSLAPEHVGPRGPGGYSDLPPKALHDPMCPHDTHPFPATCETCALIHKVRADEGEKIARAIETARGRRSVGSALWIWRDVAARFARNGGRDE